MCSFCSKSPLLDPFCLLSSLADEMTVGKVYAALMIFDFYKQNKTTRDQIHQAPGGLSQVSVSTDWVTQPLLGQSVAGGGGSITQTCSPLVGCLVVSGSPELERWSFGAEEKE
jgi:hypothetical protein